MATWQDGRGASWAKVVFDREKKKSDNESTAPGFTRGEHKKPLRERSKVKRGKGQSLVGHKAMAHLVRDVKNRGGEV